MDKFIEDSDDENEDLRSVGSEDELNTKPTRLDDSESEDEEIDTKKTTSKKSTFDAFNDNDDDEDDDMLSDEEESNESTTNKSSGSDEQKNINELFRKSKLHKLKTKKPKGKTGVVYLSKIPPYMKPAKMRQILTRFGEVDRLFLKKEQQHKYKQRLVQGGNKKIKYEEGWAEFIRKKDAKMCADTLNGNKLGGKKGNFYYDDIMNVKYLSGFKWADLTAQISAENEARQSKLQMEISQANKLNKTFIRNIEKSKMIENIKNKKKDQSSKDDDEPRRTFEQRKVTSTRADAPASLKQKHDAKLEGVLSSIF
ncbi:Pre-rRNA-processing protein [Wickerhamomyces ciferrii]|uniref:Pre-rRNA-processing protein ESF2 n=1 Tax=Wickerhamomyces ciferrii (strain ATCC 14091 / BCRC 22168 / CBS 111 / JCM 3599 / NBRC 0793 / NRRL Y-1031 F-60-10) TaxID=1206466 RepID=K0K8W0_WICCF|nr:Pre-rRNA-processing protein [Wickerhamomyces ciferrii]CCH41265.1 Pre-rRNA-processing protein [Wickerhamomyces ciferrii]